MNTPSRPDAKKILQALIELNTVENELADKPRTTKRAAYEESIAALRAKVPKPILAHHDRMKLRRRFSVGIVKSNWSCGTCHIEIPRGSHRVLQFATDLVVCENCGTYIYLEPQPEQPAAAPVVAEEKPKASRKRTALAVA